MPSPLEISWVWTWGPQDSPAQFYGFWDNPVFDCFRVVLMVLAVCLVWYALRVIVEQRRRKQKMSRPQQLRFVSLAIFALIVAANEAWLMGTTGTPRLFVSYCAVITGYIGVYGKRKQQKTETIDTIGDLT